MNIILALDKFKSGLIDLINNSGMPMAITELALEEVLVQVRQGAMQQLAKAKYEEEQKEDGEKDGRQ